jgi:SnoaL-like domain
MPTHDEVASWAEAYRVAWEQADSDGAAALFTEDATYRDNIYEEPHRGHGGIVEYWSGVTSGQSNVTVRMGDPVVDGNRADVEFWTTMDAEGSPITLAGCLLLDFDDSGRCTALREYWQVAEGSHQPPGGWGS